MARLKSPPLLVLDDLLAFGPVAGNAENVADALRLRIIEAVLPAGSELRQEELAARFGVSRQPVREALRILQAEGWVTSEPRRGAVVSAVDPDDIREVFALRGAVEIDALRRSLPLMDSADFGAAEALLDQLDATTELTAYNRLHKAFHLTLAARAGHRYRALLSDLLDAADRYLRIELQTLANHSESQAEHRALLAACRARDIDRAVSVLTIHIAEAGMDLADAIATQQRNPKP